jgi:TonB family protein
MGKTALACFVATASLFAQAEDRLQLVREFRTGAYIGGVIDSSSQLPPNRAFYRLLPKQKDIARTWYVGLAQSDEPPYPLNGPENLFNQIRTIAEHTNVKGEVALEVVVNADGRAKEARIIKSPSAYLGKSAVSAALRQRYSPGLCQSIPCEMSYPVAIRIY